ncbi:hypothetical protein DBB42_03995 [Pseudomonas plecoglossicida]|uniref:Uncharacterized protein n=1 Tax=Pseudomonas plecoglossicida TaxID=70775 RepID=A0A2R7USG1_PSEDL|nr:hypothetical protein DBB42_03995 [Pseudomonas plecoglossicida]
MWGRAGVYRLYRPLRGLARSHRDVTAFETCAVPVGAGKPAKRPAQATETFQPATAPSNTLKTARNAFRAVFI